MEPHPYKDERIEARGRGRPDGRPYKDDDMMRFDDNYRIPGSRLLKKLIGRQGNEKNTGYRNRRDILSWLLAVAMIVSIGAPILTTSTGGLYGRAELVCSHEHSAECYLVRDGHECSEDEECIPVYQKEVTVVQPGHQHGDECYLTGESHWHDDGCYEDVYIEDDEDGEPVFESMLICDKTEGEPQPVLDCDIEETEEVTEETELTELPPIGWICRYEKELICEHRDCPDGGSCVLEQEKKEKEELCGENGECEEHPINRKMPLAIPYAPSSNASSTATLEKEIGKASGGNHLAVIGITASFDLTHTVIIPSGRVIQLVPNASNNATVVIKTTGDFRHFDIVSGGALIIGDATSTASIILEGQGKTGGTADNGGIIVESGGALTVHKGGVIQKCFAANNGGGVYSAGTVTMDGGIISNSKAAGNGGGIYASGASTISGGTISGNKAGNGGGLYASGASNISGGTIISGNEAADGGGVYVSGTLTMSGGKISGNVAAYGGGGIYTYNNTVSAVKITGGEISGNNSLGNGGGIFVGSQVNKPYDSIEITKNVVFSGNSASKVVDLEKTAAELYSYFPNIQSAFSTGIPALMYPHPLNNYDINIPEYTVTAFYVDQNDRQIGSPEYKVYTYPIMKRITLNGADIPGIQGYEFSDWKYGLAGTPAGNLKPQGNTLVDIPDGVSAETNIYLMYKSPADWARLNLALTGVYGADVDSVVIHPYGASSGKDWKAGRVYNLVIQDGDRPDNYTIGAIPLGGAPISDPCAISINRQVALTAANGSTITLLMKGTGRHFIVDGGNFTIGDTGFAGTLVLQGKGQTSGSVYDGGVRVESSGALTINNGAIIQDCYWDYGGGMYTSGGAITVSGGVIRGNTAEYDGGGIYTNDYSLLTIDENTIFQGNKAGNGPYWLEDYMDTAMANPTVDLPIEITVGALMALHNGTNLPASGSSLSAPPESVTSMTSWSAELNYLANNLDLNFFGDAGELRVSELGRVPFVDYGAGNVPVMRTLYGLAGSVSGEDLGYHVVNPGAQDVTTLMFRVENPAASQWSLYLHCDPFVSDDGETGAIPVAVDQESGQIVETAFVCKTSTVRMYCRERYISDFINAPGAVDDIGTWSWDKLEHDIKVEALSGGPHSDEYTSMFIWTFAVAPIE